MCVAWRKWELRLRASTAMPSRRSARLDFCDPGYCLILVSKAFYFKSDDLNLIQFRKCETHSNKDSIEIKHDLINQLESRLYQNHIDSAMVATDW